MISHEIRKSTKRSTIGLFSYTVVDERLNKLLSLPRHKTILYHVSTNITNTKAMQNSRRISYKTNQIEIADNYTRVVIAHFARLYPGLFRASGRCSPMSGRAEGLLDDKRPLSVLILGLLLFVAGCTAIPFGGPSEQEHPVKVVLNNSANQTQTFTVWVVTGEVQPDGIIIYKKNGEIDNASPGQGLSSYYLGGDYGHVTSVEPPPNRSRLHGQYVLSRGETKRSTVENFTIGSTIVVSLAEHGRVIELTTANCDEQSLVGLEVVSRPTPPGGASAAYGCR